MTNKFYVVNNSGEYISDWDHDGEPERTKIIEQAHGFSSYKQADDACVDATDHVVRHPDFITHDRVYRVAIHVHTGKTARSFDWEDESENRDDFDLFEGTRAELIDLARRYHGSNTYGDRVAEALISAVDGDICDLYSPKGKLPTRKDVIEQLNRCVERINEAIAKGAVMPTCTFAEDVVRNFRHSFGMFHLHRPALADLSLTHVDLYRHGALLDHEGSLTWGFTCGDVLHLSKILHIPLNSAYEKFATPETLR